MQVPLPVAVLFQIFSHVLGNEDVTGVTAIHHSLRDVDSGPGNVGTTTYVHHTAHRSTMDSHSQLELGVFPRCATDLQGAVYRGFWSVVEHQRHSISSRHGNEPAICFGRAKMFGFAHNPIKEFEQSSLFVSYELGVTDDVDEEHVGYLQL